MFIITDLNSGGAEWQLARLAAKLPEHGFSVKTICLFGVGEVAGYLQERNVEVICLDFDKPWKIWRLIKLRKEIKKYKPDIINSWMFHANITAKIIGSLGGIKKIIASLRVAEKERPHHVSLERISSFLNTKITCNSKSLRNFAEQFGFPGHKLVVIPNSYDDKIFHFQKHRPPSSNEYWKFMYIGRLTKQKGIEYLLEALQILKEKYPSVKLDIYGKADSGYEEKIKNIMADRKLERIVEIKGAVSHTCIPGLMKEYHVLVLPSLWEGMPNVILEAFASGLPVIATNIEGSKDIVKHGKTGLLSEAGRPEELAKNIRDTIENYDDAIKMAGSAYKYLLQNHSPENICRIYSEFFRQIAAE